MDKKKRKGKRLKQTSNTPNTLGTIMSGPRLLPEGPKKVVTMITLLAIMVKFG